MHNILRRIDTEASGSMNDQSVAPDRLAVQSAVLQERDAARYIGMSVPFLRQSRMHGARLKRTPGPPYIRVGRAIRYLRTDLDAWLESHRVQP